jgi:all-trans-retinol 13,14-reductase
MSAHREFNAIVIGSAKLRKWRVLVLERHFKIGGFTHTFSRPGGWPWDVGLHYVGEMGEGMMGRRLFDFITDGGVRWNPMPDVCDVFEYPTLQVSACKGEANFWRALIDTFPNEGASIKQYFQDLKAAIGWINRHLMAMAAPTPLSWIVRLVNRFTANLPLGVTHQYLTRRFRDPRLRVVVVSQWADYGMPPGQSAFPGTQINIGSLGLVLVR